MRVSPIKSPNLEISLKLILKYRIVLIYCGVSTACAAILAVVGKVCALPGIRTILAAVIISILPVMMFKYFNQKKDEYIAEKQKITDELQAARNIQRSLLPDMPSDIMGLELEAFNEPAGAVGGDFYDVFRIDETHLGIVVGDVTGKGMPAALLMSMACGIIRTEAAKTLSPAQLLARVNNILCTCLPRNKFVAVSYAVLDTVTMETIIANAGQISPYLTRNSDGKVENLDIGGVPLGICRDTDYYEVTIELTGGDKLLFTSDGTVEAMNKDREIYGFERFETDLAAVLNENCRKTVSNIIDRIKNYAAGVPQADDITMLVVGVG